MRSLLNKIKAWHKNIKNPFKWVGRAMKYEVNSVLNFYYWWITKRRALRAWRYTGLQHHIVPSGKTTITIVNNRWLKWYNKQPGVKKININDLLNQAYFSTPQGKRIITKTK